MHSILFCMAFQFSLVAASTLTSTHTVSPNTDASTIRNALSSCSAGDTLLVLPGDYGEQQYIGNYQPDGEVKIIFPSQSWFGAVLQIVDCKNLTIENLWQMPATTNSLNSSSIVIRGTSTANVVIRNSRIDAHNARYGIQIAADTPDQLASWPDGITIDNCEVYSSNNDDLINVNGANHLIIRNCHLHDPIISSGTSTNIDGVQVIRARSIYILDNWITFVNSASGYVRDPNLNPDPGVSLSTTGTQGISHFEIRGNHFVQWVPGTPILVSGANVSDGQVYGNTLVDCPDQIAFGSPLGTNITAFANFSEETNATELANYP